MSKPSFNFVGELMIPRKTEDFFKEWTKKDAKGKEKERNSIRFGVKENGRNVGYVSLNGFVLDDIRTMDTNGNQITIDWDDRLLPETVPNVAYFRRYRVNLGEEHGGQQEFITQYDFVDFLGKWLPTYKGKVRASGTWEKNPYNGNITDRFVLQNVYAVSDDERSKLQLTMEFFYNNDSVNMRELEKEGKIYIDGYVSQYIKGIGNEYFHQNAILCNTAYNLDNEKHLEIWNFKKSFFEKLSSKKMYKMLWDCRYLNGAQEIEFDESMLTPQQKFAVEHGLADLDSYRPKGDLFGSKIREVRLELPKFTGDYSEGAVECDEKVSEFQEKIFSFAKEEKLEDIIEEEKTPAQTAEEILDTDEDLF